MAFLTAFSCKSVLFGRKYSRMDQVKLFDPFFHTLSDLSFRKENETLLFLHVTKILIFVLAVFE